MAISVERTRMRTRITSIDAYPAGFLSDGGGYRFDIPGVNRPIPIDVRVGTRAKIPILYLQVTREFTDGCSEHDKNIKKAFEKTYRRNAEAFLEHNPVQVVAVPRSLSMNTITQAETWDLIILDGNGRARWAPKYDIQQVSSNVQSIYDVTNNFYREGFHHVTPEMVAKALKRDADRADGSYLAAKEEPLGRRGVRYATPRPVTTEELYALVPDFSAKLAR